MAVGVLRAIKHLLPDTTMWRLRGTLGDLMSGVASSAEDVADDAVMSLNDMFPDTTRCIDEWEEQWGISRYSGVDDAGRRKRIDAHWKMRGGQDPTYLQRVLQDNGFDLHVHDWFIPDDEVEPTVISIPHALGELNLGEAGVSLGESEQSDYLDPCGVARDPRPLVNGLYTGIDPVDRLGEWSLGEGRSLGSADTVEGYPLVGDAKSLEYVHNNHLGNSGIVLGMGLPLLGGPSGIEVVATPPQIPADVSKWPYLVYIGAETFGEIAEIGYDRREELEELILSVFPAHLWKIILVRYV